LSGGQEYDALHKHRGDHMNVKTLITAVIGIAALIRGRRRRLVMGVNVVGNCREYEVL